MKIARRETTKRIDQSQFCNTCKIKLNIKNIVRLCKKSENHIFCKECFENHKINKMKMDNKKELCCPECDSIIDYNLDKTKVIINKENIILGTLITASHFNLI